MSHLYTLRTPVNAVRLAGISDICILTVHVGVVRGKTHQCRNMPVMLDMVYSTQFLRTLSLHHCRTLTAWYMPSNRMTAPTMTTTTTVDGTVRRRMTARGRNPKPVSMGLVLLIVCSPTTRCSTVTPNIKFNINSPIINCHRSSISNHSHPIISSSNSNSINSHRHSNSNSCPQLRQQRPLTTPLLPVRSLLRLYICVWQNQ